MDIKVRADLYFKGTPETDDFWRENTEMVLKIMCPLIEEVEVIDYDSWSEEGENNEV